MSGREEQLESGLTNLPSAEDMTAAANRVGAVRSVDANPLTQGGCPKILAGQVDAGARDAIAERGEKRALRL